MAKWFCSMIRFQAKCLTSLTESCLINGQFLFLSLYTDIYIYLVYTDGYYRKILPQASGHPFGLAWLYTVANPT